MNKMFINRWIAAMFYTLLWGSTMVSATSLAESKRLAHMSYSNGEVAILAFIMITTTCIMIQGFRVLCGHGGQMSQQLTVLQRE